jgi:hypothetical protein
MLIKIRELEYQIAWEAFDKARREFQNHMITEGEFLQKHRAMREALAALEEAEATGDDYE